jgi:hypothetical protein
MKTEEIKSNETAKTINHPKFLRNIAASTDEKFIVYHKDPVEKGHNKLVFVVQDNRNDHDTEYYRRKFLENGFTEVKNESILEKKSQSSKKITPFTGEGKGTKVEIFSSFNKTQVRIIIKKNELSNEEVKKLENVLTEFRNNKKIKKEIKEYGLINSFKNSLNSIKKVFRLAG